MPSDVQYQPVQSVPWNAKRSQRFLFRSSASDGSGALRPQVSCDAVQLARDCSRREMDDLNVVVTDADMEDPDLLAELAEITGQALPKPKPADLEG